MLPVEEQLRILKRGVAEIVPEGELHQKLARSVQTGQPLRVKLGIDPTASDIHLGFAVVLRKLRQWQDLGHIAVLIIGDRTATVGDPTGRSETRPQLTLDEVRRNAQTYTEQIFRILDPQRTEVRYNSEWLDTLTLGELVFIASQITVARMLEREDFAQRFKNEQPIALHEFLYPLMQAYDSVAVRADVEMGGLDQKFNILTGRDIQRAYGQEPQVAFLMPLLLGLDGVRKMSKSFGNYIGIAEPPEEMFGKVMRIPDELMRQWFILCTDVPEREVDALLAGHPMDAKKRLAWEIVRLYHGEDAADKAQAAFARVFQQRELPSEPPTVEVPAEWQTAAIADLLVALKLLPSKNEAKRLIVKGAVELNGERITDWRQVVTVRTGDIVRVGKRKFAKLVVSQ
ncbi:Tyrosine--tRNA ligase [bacterium HR17]|uniref:Tyrosine--tRNA ligase n=1 Tax=Candidatus Fervidibacter japonicus TaxID=2035412 RepID=A0A2H5XG42_9BACT|nr:Tyrosine--tRNA ligase [bacterium HR17]